MTGSLAASLSGLVAAAAYSVQYLNFNSPFTWPRSWLIALARCAVDAGAGVAAYFVIVGLLHLSGTKWWWAAGLSAPAILRTYVTTWQSSAGDSVQVGPGFIYDWIADRVDAFLERRQNADVDRWLHDKVELRLAEKSAGYIVDEVVRVIQTNNPRRHAQVLRTIVLKKQAMEADRAADDRKRNARMELYHQIVRAGGRGVLKRLVGEVKPAAPPVSSATGDAEPATSPSA